MRAQRIHAWGGPLHLEEVPSPRPAEGEVLVQVAACGVGLTVLNYMNGDLGRRAEDLPRVPGHEFTGVVAEVGPGVQGWKPGDRVLAYFYLSCGRCAACRRAREPLCHRFGGFVGVARDGGYAEFSCLPAGNLLPLPEGVDFVSATTIPDAVATSFHVCHSRAELRPGETAVVVGAGGGVGVHLVQMAALFGAQVIAVDVDERKLHELPKFGAAVAAPFGPAAREAVAERTRGLGADVVVDLVGSAETLSFSASCLAPRGRLVLLTTFRDVSLPVFPRELVLKETALLGSRYASKWEVLKAAELVTGGRIRPVVSQVAELSQVEAIHTALREGRLFGRGAISFPWAREGR